MLMAARRQHDDPRQLSLLDWVATPPVNDVWPDLTVASGLHGRLSLVCVVDPLELRREMAQVAFEDGYRLGAEAVPAECTDDLADALRDWHTGRPLSVSACVRLESGTAMPEGRRLHDWRGSGRARELLALETDASMRRFYRAARLLVGEESAAKLLFRRAAMAPEVALAMPWAAAVLQAHRELLRAHYEEGDET